MPSARLSILGTLLLLVILDHALEISCRVFEIICEMDLGSCVKRYIYIYIYFFFVLTQISFLNFVQTWTLQYLGFKGWRKQKISLKYDHHLRNIGKVIKDSTDHRVSFYHRFLNKRIHNKSKEMIKEKHLVSCEVGKRILACWDPFFLMHGTVSAISHLWVLSGLSHIFL